MEEGRARIFVKVGEVDVFDTGRREERKKFRRGGIVGRRQDVGVKKRTVRRGKERAGVCHKAAWIIVLCIKSKKQILLIARRTSLLLAISLQVFPFASLKESSTFSCSSNKLTISTRPKEAAKWRGVVPELGG